MDVGSRVTATAVDWMSWAERSILVLVGCALFGVAAAFIFRTLLTMPQLFDPNSAVLPVATVALNDILLVLMVVELVYTVTLSLRGIMLSAEPFLIVGMIATIRRMLVITIGEGSARGTTGNELLTLTAVLAVFVASIFPLNLRTRTRARILQGANPQTLPNTVHGEIFAKNR